MRATPFHLGQRLVLWLIHIYRYTLSALIGRQCRFLPTCSEYAAQAVRTHGVIQGTRLAFGRIARCHPWGDSGFDPVPDAPHSADRRKKDNSTSIE